MNTQVIFKTDKRLKQEAIKKAKIDGLTLRTVLSNLMKYYVEGKLNVGVHITSEPEVELIEVDTKTQKKMDEIGELLKRI